MSSELLSRTTKTSIYVVDDDDIDDDKDGDGGGLSILMGV